MNHPTFKRILTVIALFIPALLLVFFTLQPQTDVAVALPLFHFYIVTFTTFSAAVISILLSVALREVARPRHFLAAVAFVVIATIFFAHGFSTPGALISYVHPALSWSAWLTLFGGGAVFALAALNGADESSAWLQPRAVAYIAAGGVVFYLTTVTLAPQWYTSLEEQVSPWHRQTLFYLTMGVWLFATLRLGQTWSASRSRVDGVLAFIALWMAFAAVSLHQFPVWQISWWLYHFILLVGFLVIVYVLLTEYEQLRQFRLLYYYLAISLIVTALLALVASYFFAQFANHTLVAEKRANATSLVTNLISEIAAEFPADTPPAEALDYYAAHLSSLPIGNVIIYDTQNQVVYPDSGGYGYGEGSGSDTVSAERLVDFEQALSGQTMAQVYFPTDMPGDYNPFGELPTVITYAPLRLMPQPGGQIAGVLVTLQPAPDLSETILRARATGLLITAGTMGLLFTVLLLVVARADRIITARTRELAVAYANLRRAEGMRNDLTNMIVHDLRNPLTTIYATLGLIRHLNSNDQTETRLRYVDQAHSASERMTGLIDDILAVSKIEAGQLKPKISLTPLAQMLTNRLENFMAQAADEEKQLTLDCSPNLIAPLDPNMIGRVVENLVSNALKYTKKGGQIEVSAWSENGYLQVRVRDNGEGIPDKFKKYIFEKFAQAPNSDEKPNRKGTGLGLAFCGLAVKAHAGQIWVEDAPHGGSDFVFRLPQTQEQEQFNN